MVHKSEVYPGASDPTQAFEALGRDVRYLETAIKGLIAKRDETPDYSPTLAAILASQKEAQSGLLRIEQSPAIKLSPAAMVVELGKASEGARSADREMLHQTRDSITQAVGRIDGIVERGQAAEHQFEQKVWWATGGLVVGALILAIVPGMIVRALPESWHMPERMAARSIGLDMASAGKRLSRVAGDLGGSEVASSEVAGTAKEPTPPVRHGRRR